MTTRYWVRITWVHVAERNRCAVIGYDETVVIDADSAAEAEYQAEYDAACAHDEELERYMPVAHVIDECPG